MSARRVIAHLLVALLLGALVNVLVALGCTYIGLPSETWEIGHQRIDSRPWFVGIGARPGARQVMSRRMSERDFDVLGRDYQPITAPSWSRAHDPDAAVYALEDARGWPSLAFTSTIEREGDDPLAAKGGIIIGRGRESVALHGDLWTLPYRPMLPGVIVNTALYAFVVLLLLNMGPAVRGLWRHRRGQCSRCGYPLRTGPRCPECGWATRERAGMA